MKLRFPTFNRAKKTVKSAVAGALFSIAGAIMHVAHANLWRDSFNPLRGLTMRAAVAYLEEGERGAYADLMWVYRFIEKRDATLRGGKRSLIGGVAEKDWDIRTLDKEFLPEGITKADVEAQEKTLRTAYDRIGNLRDAIEHLALAEFRGFAHLEKHYAQGGEADGAVVHLEPVEQWYLCRDGRNGPWHYNKGAVSGQIRGEELNLENWIIREIDDPIDEIALIAFVRKNLSQKDWDGFVETFGIPSIFIELPANIPEGKDKEYQATVEKIIGNSRGAIPNGSDVKTVNAGQLGTPPFAEHLKYQDEQIVMAITSGLLTMLAESGSGTLAGGAHSETFDRIVRALANRVSETFQQQFDRQILAEAHPGKPVLAWFQIAANEEEDTGEFIKNVKELHSAGYHVSADQVQEKTGLRLEEKEAPEPPPGNPRAGAAGGDPAGNVQNRRRAAAARVQNRFSEKLGVPPEWVAPLGQQLAEIEAMATDQTLTDADLLSRFESAVAATPELLADMDIEAFASVLEASMGAAAIEGVRKAMKTRNERTK